MDLEYLIRGLTKPACGSRKRAPAIRRASSCRSAYAIRPCR